MGALDCFCPHLPVPRAGPAWRWGMEEALNSQAREKIQAPNSSNMRSVVSLNSAYFRLVRLFSLGGVRHVFNPKCGAEDSKAGFWGSKGVRWSAFWQGVLLPGAGHWLACRRRRLRRISGIKKARKTAYPRLLPHKKFMNDNRITGGMAAETSCLRSMMNDLIRRSEI